MKDIISKIKYGIIVINPALISDDDNGIVHFCGLEEYPTEEDFAALKTELYNSDLDFDCDFHQLIFGYASEDDISFFKGMLSNENSVKFESNT